MDTDKLCNIETEVKLYRLTNSELEKYLGKPPQDKTPMVRAKGDNTGTAPTVDDEQSSQVHSPVYSKSGRPLRTAASKQTYVDCDDSENSDSELSTVVPKVDNRTSRSKPRSSGPSAS